MKDRDQNRRHELIIKKIDGIITSKEKAELEVFQNRLAAELEHISPLDARRFEQLDLDNVLCQSTYPFMTSNKILT